MRYSKGIPVKQHLRFAKQSRKSVKGQQAWPDDVNRFLFSGRFPQGCGNQGNKSESWQKVAKVSSSDERKGRVL